MSTTTIILSTFIFQATLGAIQSDGPDWTLISNVTVADVEEVGCPLTMNISRCNENSKILQKLLQKPWFLKNWSLHLIKKGI